VLNNPIRFNDPTGHVCSDPEDPTPTCENGGRGGTRVGNRIIRGGGTTDSDKDVEKDEPQVDVTEWLAIELDIQQDFISSYYSGICELDVFCKLGLHNMLFGNHQRYDIKRNMSGLAPGGTVVLCGNDGCRWVDYSAPGNIMYGYLSGIAGIPQNISWIAGGILESIDIGYVNPDYQESWFDNPGDKGAVDFGYQLAKDFPDGITVDQFASALNPEVLNTFQRPDGVPRMMPVPQTNSYPPGYFLNP
jgi:hypothetical protein